MDDADVSPALAANLMDLRRANRWFGGQSLVGQFLLRRMRNLPPNTPLSLLDVGTGGGDIPITFLKWAAETNCQGWTVGLDRSLAVTKTTARWIDLDVTNCPSLVLAQGDGCALPFADQSFDFVLCTLTAHHLGVSRIVVLLREMARVARRTLLVTDLQRSWMGLAGVWLLSHVGMRSPLTRHDGPLSVRRSYTVDEMTMLGRKAGLPDAVVRGHAPFRLSLIWDRPET